MLRTRLARSIPSLPLLVQPWYTPPAGLTGNSCQVAATMATPQRSRHRRCRPSRLTNQRRQTPIIPAMSVVLQAHHRQSIEHVPR